MSVANSVVIRPIAAGAGRGVIKVTDLNPLRIMTHHVCRKYGPKRWTENEVSYNSNTKEIIYY